MLSSTDPPCALDDISCENKGAYYLPTLVCDFLAFSTATLSVKMP